MLCFSISVASAKDIYLSATGQDLNDGLSSFTSVATFSKAYSIATAGDIINVSGYIDMSVDPTNTAFPKSGFSIAKNITIQGASVMSDGFDGKNLTRIFTVDGANLSIKKLTLKNGKYGATGLNGGALLVNSGSISAETVVFDGNTAFDATSTGGAVLVNTTTGLTFNNCSFLYNTGKGGAFYLQDTGNPSVKINFIGCSFISNTSTTIGGSAAYINMSNSATNNEIYFINSTFTKNHAPAANGGVINLNASCLTTGDLTSVNLINCTLTANTTQGITSICAGIYVNDNTRNFKGKLNISNSIIEGNYNETTPTYSDLYFTVTPTTTNLMIHNSFIGRYLGATNPTACFPGDNKFNYLTATSTVLDLQAQFATFDNIRKLYPLLAASPAINFGDAQYLQAININTDQTGTIRTFTNNKCYIGAVEQTGQLSVTDGSQSAIYKHLIMYGQSLSTGHQAYPVISTTNIAGNYMIGDQIWENYGNTKSPQFNPLIGTISNAFKTQTNIMNRSAGTIAECPLFGAANHIQLKNPGEKLLATSCGTSGMSIEQLSKESQTKTFYSDYLNTLKYAAQIAQSTNSSISCPAIFWLQGEWNYQTNGEGLTLGSLPTADKNAYKALMITLKNNMQADVQKQYGQTEKPLFITYEVGAQYIKGKEQAIGMAQLEASNEYSDIVCAGSIYPMTDRGGHLDPNGYRWYGEMLGKVYYKTKVLGQDFKPLQPKEISRTELANKLKVKFLVPNLPLVLDQLILAKVQDYGFQVYANNVRQTITSVTIVDDCVYLTCASSLAGIVEVVYAGQDTGGSGNLRDSDSYQSFFKYIDLDKKNTDGTYLFPRDATETTLRPTYEPKDVSGNVIYDQPYPLYNFCVSFYYRLAADQQTYTVPILDSATGITLPIVDNNIKAFQLDDQLVLTVNLSEKPLKVTLYNISGSLVKTFPVEPSSAKTRYEYPLNSLSVGIYLAKIETENRFQTVKLVIR